MKRAARRVTPATRPHEVGLTNVKARALGGAGPSEIVFADWLDGSEPNPSRPDNQDWQRVGAVVLRIVD